MIPNQWCVNCILRRWCEDYDPWPIDFKKQEATMGEIPLELENAASFGNSIYGVVTTEGLVKLFVWDGCNQRETMFLDAKALDNLRDYLEKVKNNYILKVL